MTKGEAIRIVSEYHKRANSCADAEDMQPFQVELDAIKRLLQEVKRDGRAN